VKKVQLTVTGSPLTCFPMSLATSTHGDVDCNNSVLHCNYYLDIFFCILAIKYKLAFCYTALDIFAVYLLLILASDITD